MPHFIELEIAGVTYEDIYEASYEVYSAKDNVGRPSDMARAGLIHIKRKSDKKVDIAQWAADPGQPNWQAGTLTFHEIDGAKMKTLKWTNGFILKYKEHCPDIVKHPDELMYEEFDISCETIEVENVVITNEWFKKNKNK